MADRHESDGRESPESPQTGRSGELHPVPSGATSTERDDTHVSAENEYFSALDLEELQEADDLAQVRADDVLLDALAAEQNGAGSGDALAEALHTGDFDEQLNALLLAWRKDVDSVPVPDIVDAKTAVATVTAAKSARRRRPRMLVPVAAAAAVLAVAFAGVGMAARGAEPGDALWGLSKVLYADHARSVEAAQSVRTDLNDAQQALEQGRINEARDALNAAGSALPNVSTEDGKDVLKKEHDSLIERLTSPPTTSTQPRSESQRPLPTNSSSTSPTPSSTSSSQPPSNPPSSTPPSNSSTLPPNSGTNGGDSPGTGNGSPPRSDTPSGGGTPQVGNGISGGGEKKTENIAPSGS